MPSCIMSDNSVNNWLDILSIKCPMFDFHIMNSENWELLSSLIEENNLEKLGDYSTLMTVLQLLSTHNEDV